MQKIKNIEFLRTFLICTIVMLHAFISRKWCLCNLFPDINLYQNIKSAIAHANNGVEGFFIIAGFLLVITFKNSSTVKDFIKKKYIRLSPAIAFATLLCVFGLVLHTMHFKLIPNILTVFLLNHFGICWAVGSNPVLWFTSVLFSALLVYFCLFKFVPKKYNKFLILLLVIFGYGVLEFFRHGSFAKPLVNYCGIFNVGFLRGLGGVGLGCLIGQFYKDNLEKIQNFTPKGLQKKCITAAEILLLFFVIWWTTFVHSRINNIVFVLGFAILLALFVCKKGWLSRFFDKDIWVTLGRYQYSVYVIHYVIIRIYGLALWKNHPEFVTAHPVVPIFIMLFSIILVGAFTYHFVEVPCAEFLKKLWLDKSKKVVITENPGEGRL